MNQQPISILLCAIGGEGGGVLTQWLIDVARHAGYAAQATSIPGVAQRTGATTYYLEVFPVPLKELGGKRPVFGLNPLPGKLDLLVSSELLETTRQVGHGLASKERTVIISSTSRTLTTLEKMQLGDGRQSDESLLQIVQTQSREQHLLDMATLAKSSGTVVSAVMLGAIAGSGLLPFARGDYEAAIAQSGSGAQASLKGFDAALNAVTALTPPQPVTIKPEALNFVTLGKARVIEYQNAKYGQLYQQRVDALARAENLIDPEGTHAGALTNEAVRWLALWMCYDDIIRVADLKSSASRSQRVRSEVKAKADDLIKVYDHFKPGVPEFASLLPESLSKRLMAWDARRVARGKEAWNMPLQVGSHGVAGMLSLRVLASLKGLRPTSSRFHEEQALIERWLAAVHSATERNWQLGMELAQCGRLIKGYGSTNERAKRNLLHIVDELAQPARFATEEGLQLTVTAIAAARAAALQDEAGKALDQTLIKHGAAARPVQAVPIRWVKRPPGLGKVT